MRVGVAEAAGCTVVGTRLIRGDTNAINIKRLAIATIGLGGEECLRDRGGTAVELSARELTGCVALRKQHHVDPLHAGSISGDGDELGSLRCDGGHCGSETWEPRIGLRRGDGSLGT